jgi:hypothetical protein
MTHDCSSSRLYTLRDAAAPDINWPQLYRRAVAAGCCEIVSVGEERVAAADELVARSLRELVLLGELAAYASFPILADDCRRPLERTCAALLRLLDRALLANGRDLGYRVDAWRESAMTAASAVAAMIDDRGQETWPLPAAITRVANRISDAQVAFPRDRLGVPELLAETAGELLVVYAAAIETD